MNITIYSLSTCPFCYQAKQLLDAKGIDYTLHELDSNPAELNAAKKKWGHPTVPIVIVDGKLIGGATELQAFAAKGGLD
jgi:glutaredoxin 3